MREMRNLVVILGAGASYEYNAPLMKNFFHVATQLYSKANKSNLSNLNENFELVFAFIDKLQKSQAKANINLHNIEQIYSALEMAKLLKLDELRIGRSWKQMEVAMKYFLTKTIEERVVMMRSNSFPNYQSTSRPSFVIMGDRGKNIDNAVEHLVSLKKQGWNVTIITFNYDLVIESILATKDFEANYELDASNSIPSNTIQILKLHGSINWTLETKNRKSVITSVPIFKVGMRHKLDRYFNLSRDNRVTSRFCEDSEPFIIPPVWNKTTYQTQLGDIWRKAAVSLSNATHIYSLGYSLPETDGFFKHLYALGTVGPLPLLEFKVFDIEDPSQINGVRERYLSMLGRGAENVFTYSDQGTPGFAADLANLAEENH